MFESGIYEHRSKHKLIFIFTKSKQLIGILLNSSQGARHSDERTNPFWSENLCFENLFFGSFLL